MAVQLAQASPTVGAGNQNTTTVNRVLGFDQEKVARFNKHVEGSMRLWYKPPKNQELPWH